MGKMKEMKSKYYMFSILQHFKRFRWNSSLHIKSNWGRTIEVEESKQTSKKAGKQTNRQTNKQTHTHTNANTQASTHTHTLSLSHTHNIYVGVGVFECMSTRAHKHLHTNTHTHTHIYIYIYVYNIMIHTPQAYHIISLKTRYTYQKLKSPWGALITSWSNKPAQLK